MSNREGWRKNAISIRVEPNPGAHIEDAAEDMLALSKRLDVGVRSKFNGIEITAWPHHTGERLRQQYEDGLRRKV